MKRLTSVFLALVLVLGLFLQPALAGQSVTASVTAQNTGTTGVLVKEYGTLRVSGTFVATVTLQRAENCTDPPTCTAATWIDTGDTHTGNSDGSTGCGVFPFTDHTNRVYRAWVKTGGYTSGTVSLEIGSAN
jgi:hypothetical protein